MSVLYILLTDMPHTVDTCSLFNGRLSQHTTDIGWSQLTASQYASSHGTAVSSRLLLREWTWLPLCWLLDSTVNKSHLLLIVWLQFRHETWCSITSLSNYHLCWMMTVKLLYSEPTANKNVVTDRCLLFESNFCIYCTTNHICTSHDLSKL